MRTTKQYLKEEGAFHAGKFLLHKIKRRELSVIADHSTTRRALPKLTADESFIFDEAVSRFRAKGAGINIAIDSLIADAFRKNSKRTFEIIAMASDYVSLPYQTKHGKNVLATMQAAAKIMIEENRYPTMLEVKKLVIIKLESAAFALAEGSRWTEVFDSADLSFLSRGKDKKK